MRNAAARRQRETATVRIESPENGLKQARLPGTIGAHQANLVTAVYRKTGPFKQQVSATAKRDIVKRKHGGMVALKGDSGFQAKMIKLVIALVIIACIAPFFIKGPDGEPLMTLDDWASDMPELPELPVNAGDTEPSAPQEVYRWQDEEGQWHFSNTPPDGAAVELVEIGEINIMESVEAPAVESSRSTTQAEVPTSAGMVSPDEMQQMMDSVSDFQSTLEQRQADLDELTSQPR